MKNLLSLTQERDSLLSSNQIYLKSNQILQSELSTIHSIHSEDLSIASNAALLLQERIDILQLALNEETNPENGSNNRGRNSSSNNVDQEGDSIWSQIVDEQSKVCFISFFLLLPSLFSTHTNLLPLPNQTNPTQKRHSQNSPQPSPP